MIDHDALQLFLESTATERYEAEEDHHVFSRPVYRAPLVPPKPRAETLDVWTLAAVAAYLKENRDKLDLDSHVVHVHGPFCVTAEGPPLGQHRLRETPIRCRLERPRWADDTRRMSIAEAITELQMMAAEGRHESHDKTREIFLDFKMIDSEVYEDDGVSQKVKTERGANSSWGRLPKPYTILKPWRTFPEAEQPASPYVVRVDTSGDGPRISFHLADGGLWKYAAVQNIAAALKKLGVEVPVLA